MAIRKLQLVNDEFYHIIQRGVEERKIFLDEEDHLRFINSLLIFNDSKPAPWGIRAFWNQRGPSSLIDYFPKNPFIEIHAFALLDNHFHLLVRQVTEKGITNFMRKIGGYAYFFNKKYKRVGPLFQGRFKSVLVKDTEQIKHIFVYIHCNPLAIIMPSWKEKGIDDSEKSINFLEEYKWSSYLDYLGKDNFPNIIKKDFFQELFGSEDKYREEIKSWILYKSSLINKKDDIILE
jgi:putative transposase